MARLREIIQEHESEDSSAIEREQQVWCERQRRDVEDRLKKLLTSGPDSEVLARYLAECENDLPAFADTSRFIDDGAKDGEQGEHEQLIVDTEAGRKAVKAMVPTLSDDVVYPAHVAKPEWVDTVDPEDFTA